MELEQITLEDGIPSPQIWEMLSPDDEFSVTLYLGQVPENDELEEEAMISSLTEEQLVEEDYESKEQIYTSPEGEEDTSSYRSKDETQEYNRRYETDKEVNNNGNST